MTVDLNLAEVENNAGPMELHDDISVRHFDVDFDLEFDLDLDFDFDVDQIRNITLP